MGNKLTPHMKTLARKNRRDLTGPEIRLWYELREFKQIGAHFRKQVPMGRYIIDFACHSKKLVIELDGDSHGCGGQKAKDDARDAWLETQGYRVMRVWNHELYENLDGVLDEIHRYLTSDHSTSLSIAPPPSIPPHEGEGGDECGSHCSPPPGGERLGVGGSTVEDTKKGGGNHV